MSFSYKDSHLLFDSGEKGPLFVAPHSGNAFHKPGDFQDQGTHFIAYKLAQNGGRALNSLISRERDIGIDFYRLAPTKKLAIEYHNHIINDRKSMTREFRKRYAWVAKDSKEHKEKRRIYNSFWNVIKKSKSPVYFIHRQFLNPIRHPSLIDVLPFTNDRRVRDIILYMNKKHNEMFKALLPFYKKSFYFKSNCVIYKDKLKNNFNLRLFRNFEPKIIMRLSKFNEAIKKHPYIKITYKQNFKGKNSTNLIKSMLPSSKYPIVQFEISEFLTMKLPDIAVNLIGDIVKGI